MSGTEGIARAVLVEQALLRGVLHALLRRLTNGNQNEIAKICAEIQFVLVYSP